jgi:BlaI family transcriptional regulator, penicillinase repressor
VDQYGLTALQLDILKALWKREEATVADVQSALRPRRKLALTTVATHLTRLERRGIIGHRTSGRQYVFRALVDESKVRRSVASEISELAERLFAGDVTGLVSHLLSDRDVDAEDLKRMRAMITKREAELRGRRTRR